LRSLTFFRLGAILVTAILTAGPAQADILAVVISEQGLQYDVSPSNYDNSPSNYDNSSSNYDNSASNYDNSVSNYDNSASNYDNGPSGKRSVVTEDGKRVGYYVFSKKGVLNFYHAGKRIFYMPGGGKTQSVFGSDGSMWCGTLGKMNGNLVLGLTRNCMLQMLMD
jgi:hypothetical protein